ncbi:carboxypeptidase regulatory-like domain-containing protein [Granulicella sp. dw_53]|uniref:TonB-dependent receptor n=1 Tax=Granulicella sp. dw_53 TaxID=2719792 RepID=UPI001BD4557E|nr:carboxypeptidase regulatory-like domain-containing protein [Granulicella sp. dw_53]
MNISTTQDRLKRKDACIVSREQTSKQIGAGDAVLDTLRRTSFALLMAAMPLVALNVIVPSAFGQASSSSDAVGRVTDTSGATVPGAVVHVINNATGAERTATTNDSGDWSIPNLPPANYRLRVEKQGFKSSEITSLDVEIGKAANGSVTLSVGQTTETVEVTTIPPQLQTQEATVGQVINQKQINDLPLNGRNVLQLATLAPGVSPPQTGQTGSPGRFGTRSLFITVDGGRGSSTNYVLDGTYVRSVRFNNMSLQPNVDTLQEFNLLRNSFSTEYGQGQAVVSMVTKSGSNSIHGTVYDFARNSIFDARNYFATTATNPVKPHFSRQQYGGTVGFPIKKDKLFVFGGFEGLRTNRDTPVYGVFPTQAQLGTPAASNQLARVMNGTFPVPTTPNGAATILGQYNYSATPTTTDNYDEYTVRADQTLSSRNSLFERYVDFNSLQFLPSVQGGINNKLIGRNGVLGHTFLITPNIVNEVRIGYNEYFNFELGVGFQPGTNFASQEGLKFVTGLTDPTQYGRANVTITPFTNVFDNVTNQGGNENILSLGDSLSIVKGKHTYKVGFQFQNRRVILIADNNATGSFTFGPCTAATATGNGTCDATNKINPITGALYTALENYQRGYCTSGCNGNFGTTRGHYRDNTYGAFFSDVWQVGRRVTINAGLRWEYNSPFVEQNGLEGTLDPTTGKIKYSKVPAFIPQAFLPFVVTDSTYSPGIIKPNKKGFGPRLGIAYEAHPGTVFRAGGGIYFDNINTNELQFTRYAAPLYYQQSLNNQFVQNLFPDPTLGSAGLPAPFSIRPNNSTPYTMEWTASLQQDLGHGVIMELAYTASGTRKLWKRYDQNMDLLSPGVNAAGASNTTNVGVRPFPQYQHGVLTSATAASANFNGGSVKVEKRAKNDGLFVLGSYQWSKNLDNNSGEVEANDTAYSTDFSFDHSYSRFDVRHRAVISGGYELPFGKGHAMLQKGIGNVLVGGWSLQPAIQLRTGYPFSPSRSGVTFGTYTPGRVNLAPGRTLQSAYKNSPSISSWFDPTAFVDPGATVQGNVRRNTLRGPGTAQVDLSAIKTFQIVERLHLQFRAEAYNIINRGIFSQPASNISTTSTVGKISSTSADNRSIQLAVKLLF